MSKYLNPEKTRVNGKDDCSGRFNIKCTIYFNGLYYTVPDPKDAASCASVHSAYSSGLFISKETKFIDQAFYDNPENWN